MLVKEYRVLVPFEIDEFRRGHLYATAEASKAETGGGEGVEVLKQEYFESSTLRPGETLSGVYTYKIYRIKSKVPWLVQKMFPDAAFELHEESWNAYPYFKTVITNPSYMKDGLMLCLETMHLQDAGDTENALDTDKTRHEIVKLDIYDDEPLKKQDITLENDPRRLHCRTTDRGPLEEDWVESEKLPVMCAYKLVTCKFNWRGIGGRIEKMMHRNYPRLLIKFHREVFALTDKWFDMDMNEIREYELKTMVELKQRLKEKQKRGTILEDDTKKR